MPHSSHQGEDSSRQSRAIDGMYVLHLPAAEICGPIHQRGTGRPLSRTAATGLCGDEARPGLALQRRPAFSRTRASAHCRLIPWTREPCAQATLPKRQGAEGIHLPRQGGRGPAASTGGVAGKRRPPSRSDRRHSRVHSRRRNRVSLTTRRHDSLSHGTADILGTHCHGLFGARGVGRWDGAGTDGAAPGAPRGVTSTDGLGAAMTRLPLAPACR